MKIWISIPTTGLSANSTECNSPKEVLMYLTGSNWSSVNASESLNMWPNLQNSPIIYRETLCASLFLLCLFLLLLRFCLLSAMLVDRLISFFTIKLLALSPDIIWVKHLFTIPSVIAISKHVHGDGNIFCTLPCYAIAAQPSKDKLTFLLPIWKTPYI